jgi:hypothetical protein
MGATECTALALKEECDDLVGVVSACRGFEHDGGLVILAS